MDPMESAAAFLSTAGFRFEQEPSWVIGEVPDFFCTGNADLWIEVKTVTYTTLPDDLGQKWDWCHRRVEKISANGRGLASVSLEATEKHIKAAFNLAREALRLWTQDDTLADRLYVVVPRDPDYSCRVLISFEAMSERHVLLCQKSNTGKYGHPTLWQKSPYVECASISDITGDAASNVNAAQLGLYDDDYMIAISLKRSNDRFRLVSVSPRGGGHSVDVVDRLRAAARKANAQFKNAIGYRAAPSLLVVFEMGPRTQDAHGFASAFYGDLAFLFPRNPSERGLVAFGRNGIWGPEKNRLTSGACLMRDPKPPLFVLNPWAKNPPPRGLFGLPEVTCARDGTVRIPADQQNETAEVR
ncbi:MAG: hypothetical protein ACREEI_07990 [Stellaceae bacterium]